MTGCPALVGGGVSGLADALRSIDCRTGETTAYAFGRLFGDHGSLLPALTILLTLYVAFFAISLLTGRARIGLSALTPRMMTLGLVLTFATSWAAYQNIIWTLTTGAPDQIASLLANTHGSATTVFADHLDQLFNAIAAAAHSASVPAPTTDTGLTPATPMVGGFTAATVLWLSALFLMLGTVGVLVTAKIALAVLLALGPLFIVLALFPGTHGLFEGWLKGLVMFTLIPLLAVLLGGTAIAALTPVVRDIAGAGAEPPTRDVAQLFLGTCVYVALMMMALKAASAIVAGWRVPGSRETGQNHAGLPVASAQATRPALTTSPDSAASAGVASAADDRIRRIVASLPSAADNSGSPRGAIDSRVRRASVEVASFAASDGRPARTIDHRLQGVGSRFRAPMPSTGKGRIS